uniref:Cadherin domain-containing protein n=1 Tax=Timema poppense TaxID=170557 RepID=A0A7R9CRW2_TIMPO|nr:unnamed protein product [Timema poppensis]
MVRTALVYRHRSSASTIRYKITGGNFGDVFNVKETTGAIFVSGPLDYETRKKVGPSLRWEKPCRLLTCVVRDGFIARSEHVIVRAIL